MKPTKFDVLLYIEAEEVNRKSLIKTLRENIQFEKASERSINSRIKELKKEGLIDEEKNRLRINEGNGKTDDYLAYLHWARMKDTDYNQLMNKNIVKVYRGILEGRETLKDLSEETNLSKPTLLKAIKTLDRNKFIQIRKKKPLTLKANLNDQTFFYINMHELSLKTFEKGFRMPKIQETRSSRLIKELIKLHTYSSTVTEGNTATEDDVEKIFRNQPTDLTPGEITEIINTKKAVETLYEIQDKEIEINQIKKLHEILMINLLTNLGEFYYGGKKIIGSKLKPPESKREIESSLNALMNFINRYEDRINPFILGSIAHFIFVTIHPFPDGNGRIGRLLHSWIHLRNNLPLFVFDPDKRNQYFNALEEGRKEDLNTFIDFCLEEMVDILCTHAV